MPRVANFSLTLLTQRSVFVVENCQDEKSRIKVSFSRSYWIELAFGSFQEDPRVRATFRDTFGYPRANSFSIFPSLSLTLSLFTSLSPSYSSTNTQPARDWQNGFNDCLLPFLSLLPKCTVRYLFFREDKPNCIATASEMASG